MSSYVLASASGLRFGFYFFLTITAAIAFMVFTLLTKPSVRRAQLGLGAVRKRLAAPFAVLVWVVFFSAIYLLSLAGFHLLSLAGFHTVTVGNDDIRLEYAVPRRAVALRYTEVGEVMRRPAYRGLWRPEIYTPAGSQLESAPGSYRHIKDAAEDIERRRRLAARP